MDKNIKANLGDQAVKGALLGALAFMGDKWGLSTEQIAVVMPVALTALAWLSTKIGDKNTTAIFTVVKAVAEAQAKKKK
jgi:hypothetical protein